MNQNTKGSETPISNFRLREPTKDRLRLLAEAENTTMTDVLTRAIEAYEFSVSVKARHDSNR